MTEPDFNFRARNAGKSRKELPYKVQKFLDGEWAKMSDWDKLDEERLQRHARALGGSVRLMRGEVQLREWRNGQEIEQP